MHTHVCYAAAFINYNLRKEALAHCIKVGNCSAVVFSPSLSQALAEVLPELDPTLHDSCFSYGEQSTLPQARNMEEEVKTTSPNEPPPVEKKQDTGEYSLQLYSELGIAFTSHNIIGVTIYNVIASFVLSITIFCLIYNYG